MYLFIDTNSFLSYFAPYARIDSLLSLKKILEKQKNSRKKENGKLYLFVTDQVIQEFKRDIADRIFKENEKLNQKKENEIYFNFSGSVVKDTNKNGKNNKEKSSGQYPQNIDDIIEEANKKIKNANKLLQNHYEDLSKTYPKDAANREKLIYEIFKLGTPIEYNDEIFRLAEIRHLKGNPPKKKNDNSYGDAINWELLLQLEDVDHLAIVTKDGDYFEETIEGKKIYRLLEEEWVSKTNKKIEIHNSLGEFIKKFDKTSTIDDEAIQEEKKYTEEDALAVLSLSNRYFTGTSSAVVTSMSAGTTYVLTSPGLGTTHCPSCKREMLSDGVFRHTSALISTSDGQTFKCPYCGTVFTISVKPLQF